MHDGNLPVSVPTNVTLAHRSVPASMAFWLVSTWVRLIFVVHVTGCTTGICETDFFARNHQYIWQCPNKNMFENQGSFRWFGMVSNWDCISSSCFIWFFVIVLFGGMSQNTSNKYVAGFLCCGTSKMLTDTVAILKCCKCQSSSNWRSRLDGWICSEQNIGQSWSYLRGYATFVCVWTFSGQVNEQFCS